MNKIHLHKTAPTDEGRARYGRLVGIDAQKGELLDYLTRVFDPGHLARWQKKHHAKGLTVLQRIESRPPFVILAGDVGCGKTALAMSVGAIIAEKLDKRVMTLETPSDIRGGGLVGQLSERVTAAFEEARVEMGQNLGILVIDEGDDLGTSRAQMQAHHEDRAGLNVLIKEIDRLARDRIPLVTILITNRANALDPALVRRAHIIRFTRPDAVARRALFELMLAGIHHDGDDLDELVRISEKSPAFSYSDLVERAAEAALLAAVRHDRPFAVAALREAIEKLEPSPLLDDTPVSR